MFHETEVLLIDFVADNWLQLEVTNKLLDFLTGRKQEVFITGLFPVMKDNLEFAVATCVIPIVPSYSYSFNIIKKKITLRRKCIFPNMI